MYWFSSKPILPGLLDSGLGLRCSSDVKRQKEAKTGRTPRHFLKRSKKPFMLWLGCISTIKTCALATTLSSESQWLLFSCFCFSSLLIFSRKLLLPDNVMYYVMWLLWDVDHLDIHWTFVRCRKSHVVDEKPWLHSKAVEGSSWYSVLCVSDQQVLKQPCHSDRIVPLWPDLPSTRESRLTLCSPMSMAACLSSAGVRISTIPSCWLLSPTNVFQNKVYDRRNFKRLTKVIHVGKKTAW